VRNAPFRLIGASFAVAMLLAAAALLVCGNNTHGVTVALRLTGRWSFLLFWMAYTGRGISRLLSLVTITVREASFLHRGRAFGLAFAAAHLVHLGLVAWLYWISETAPVPLSVLVFFLIGAAWTYLLAAVSLGGSGRLFGDQAWWIVREAGMNYILLAFARDLVPPVLRSDVLHQRAVWLVLYVPFAIMCGFAPLLRYGPIMWARRWAGKVPG
jgi:hypothetical protein